MKFSTSVISAVSLLLPAVQAHTYMSSPDPMGGYHDNAPLEPDGSNYPCKMISGGDSVRTYTPGVDDSYTITGSAVHGGGSCQISVTYDENPTKDSVFKVIQSYEGSCPVNHHGNLAANPEHVNPKIPVKFPVGLKSGKAIFAWTWFNKIGNREMYMNCARITIGGSSSSNDVFDSLPDMFVANLNIPQSQCTTQEGLDIQFPDAGQNVIVSSQEGVNLGPACSNSNYKPKPRPSPPKYTSIASAPSYQVTSRPAFVGNPDQAMPTATTLTSKTLSKVVPMPSKVPENNNNNSNNNTGNGSYNNGPSYGNNNNNNNNSNENNSNDRNEWGAKKCSNRKSMICNADKVTYNWCDENGSLWEQLDCPLNTVCTPGTDINEVPPVGKGQQYYRRHLAAHKRRSSHHRH